MAEDDNAPEIHLLAGSNGSGKSTLMAREIRHRHPGLPFVNADDLAREHYGHAAVTREEAETGQRLANERRDSLMAARQSLVTETVMSHPSKIELLERARQLGYQVVVYHVGLRSADIAVERVAKRVREGGHPVPENKIRERFERNQPLIRDAVRMADRAYVYDNSAYDHPHRLAFVMKRGRVIVPAGAIVPAWASKLYADDLRGHSLKQLNPARHSFQEAQAIGQGMLGSGSKVYVAKAEGIYRGEVLAKTELHTLQQVGAYSAIAHLSRKLDREPALGERVQIGYSDSQHATVVPLTRARAGSPEDRAKADAFLQLPPKNAVQRYPDLANAYAMVSAFATHLDLTGHPATQTAVDAFRQRLARGIAAGDKLPNVGLREDAQETRRSAPVGRDEREA